MKYDFKAIEAEGRALWEASGLHRTPAQPERKRYILEMFAYPSGDIHIGHFRNYTIGDVVARHRMMRGDDILHPFGWDAFGLPAEGAAIKRKILPREWTIGNIETGRKTLQTMALSYDWDREVRTCEPDYYKWTQWLFLLLYRQGLAYQASSTVNWCENDGILANEQCQDGKCWRCDAEVVKKPIENCWFFRYSAMAERLLVDLDGLDGWPEDTKSKQRNWIGKSTGCEIDFDFEGRPLTVFTTRPDTAWGVTFMVIAPEHPLAAEIATPEVEAYIRKASRKSEIDRTAEGEKDGVFTGRHVTNPLNGEKVPLWVADYVLAHYGTGAVMAVPAHDTRDYAFAKKYGLPVKTVITGGDPDVDDAWTGAGKMTGSGELDGTPSPDGIPAVIEHIAPKGKGRARVHNRLRDWLISRQRYWGCPIPIIHCGDCGAQPVPEKDLPVELPTGEIDLVAKGRSPLADIEAYMKADCPKCGKPARRDTDTMDTFMCSSFYLYRYLDPKNDAEPWSKAEAWKWLPVDLYIGGNEHACMHLLYFRFIAKALFDAGHVPTDEPVKRLFHHGMVYDAKGDMMSKSKGNAVSPAEIFGKWGVDVCRIAMLFFAPSDAEIKWKEDGLVGANRFVQRLWRMMEALVPVAKEAGDGPGDGPGDAYRPLRRKLHQLIARMADAGDRQFNFNTVISKVMELLNVYDKLKPDPKTDDERRVLREVALGTARVVAPLAPFLGEAFWKWLGGEGSIFRAGWPEHDPAAAKEDEVEIPVQVNGRMRDKFKVPAGTPDAELEKRALASPAVAGKAVVKVIVVKGRLVNVVVKQ
jgi:leucyl-tRNA synthetase